jgi:hypothetical protein
LNKHFGSDGDQQEIRSVFVEAQTKILQENFGPPLEVSHDHFLVTPPSHFAPQKVRGFVVGLIGNGRESMAGILDHAEILSREILLILFIHNNSKLAWMGFRAKNIRSE